MISRGLDELAFALKHLIEASWELLWDAPLSSARILQGGYQSIVGISVIVARHDDRLQVQVQLNELNCDARCVC
jgi:hypothetical protein